MKVELEITFTEDELLAMCLEKCEQIKTPIDGEFKARFMYREVTCSFVPKGTPDEETYEAMAVPPPAPRPELTPVDVPF